MQRTLALLLVAALLLAVPAASAKTVSVEVPWEKARTIIAEGDFRPKIRVELHSSERLKGKLAGTTHTGLTVSRVVEPRQALRGRDSYDPARTPQDGPHQVSDARACWQASPPDTGPAFSLLRRLFAAVT